MSTAVTVKVLVPVVLVSLGDPLGNESFLQRKGRVRVGVSESKETKHLQVT